MPGEPTGSAPPPLSRDSMPALEPPGLALFQECLARSKVYLEYGCGGSTIQAAQAGVEAIYSVDTDGRWIAQVLDVLRGTKVRFRLLHCDFGPVVRWGYPESRAQFQHFHAYPTSPWETARKDGRSPGLVLIDGRFRVACFLYTLACIGEGVTILVDDYAPRQHYRVMEEFCKPARMAGRLAMFQPQGTPDVRDLLRRFGEFIADPS